MDKPHPISLLGTYFTRISIDPIQGYSPIDIALTLQQPDNKLGFEKHPDELDVYIASMRTLFNQERDTGSPYAIDIECIGLFKIDSDQIKDDTEVAKAVTITSHSVLYGAIRETILWITGRQVNGPLTLGLSVLKPQKPE